MIRAAVPYFAIAIFGVLNVSWTPASAQDENQSKASEREQRMSIMSALVGEIRMFETVDGRDVELHRSEEPISHFSDNVRQFEDGTLWIYSRKSRPVALIKVTTNQSSSGRWWHCVTSLSTNRLRAEKSGRSLWTPDKPGVVFRPLLDALPEASTATPYLLRMRSITRRFKAHQFWNPGNQRFDLRLLPRPVWEYSDESTGVLAGGVFVFTHGVTPALVLILEAVDDEKAGPWRYGIAKLGSAEFHASLDDKEIYQSPRAAGVTGRPMDPYFLFSSTEGE